MQCVHVSLGEYLVHGVHEAMPDVAAPTSRSLSKANEVIDEHVNMRYQPWKDLQGGTVFQLWQRSWSGLSLVISQWAEHGRWTMIIGAGQSPSESWVSVVSHWAEGGQRTTFVGRGWFLAKMGRLRWFPAIVERRCIFQVVRWHRTFI